MLGTLRQIFQVLSGSSLLAEVKDDETGFAPPCQHMVPPALGRHQDRSSLAADARTNDGEGLLPRFLDAGPIMQALSGPSVDDFLAGACTLHE